jgi:RHS repeat-associated protein
VYRSASLFRRSPLALGHGLPTFRAMAVSSVLKNSHSRTIPRRMPAHVGAGVPANRNVHRGLSRSTYDSHRGEYYVDELLATQTSASNNDISGYTLCANEGQAFALPSTCDVAYGANGSFAFRSAQSGTITFSNATFGDPAPGAPKKGYYRLSGGQRFYAHANHLYSVAALTDAAGSVVERYSYDAYGARKITAPDGITVRVVSSYNQQIGFTGRFFDRESGLYYFRSRYYSGSLGRFIGRDPLTYVDGYSLYGAYYIPNSIDPFGLTEVNIVTRMWIDLSRIYYRQANDGGTFNRVFTGGVLWGIWAATNDNGDSAAKDGKYRIWGKRTYNFTCDCYDNITLNGHVKEDSAVGREGGLVPGPAVFYGKEENKISDKEYEVKWGIYGQPHYLDEVGMQLAKGRTSKRIWNYTTVNFTCKSGQVQYETKVFGGSNFPTHELFINSQKERSLPQGPITDLWNPEPGWPDFVGGQPGPIPPSTGPSPLPTPPTSPPVQVQYPYPIGYPNSNMGTFGLR